MTHCALLVDKLPDLDKDMNNGPRSTLAERDTYPSLRWTIKREERTPIISLLQREWKTAVTNSSDDRLWLQSKSLDTLQTRWCFDRPPRSLGATLAHQIALLSGEATSVVLLPIDENIMLSENYGKEEIRNIIPLALCKEMITREIWDS